MAQELLYNAIRITKNDNSAVKAIIKDANGEYITGGDMKLVIADTDISVTGNYDEISHTWSFIIPPHCDLNGRFMYHFQYDGIYLDFPQPIYFV